MGKLTSKYQLTLPKAVAHEVGLKPGDELDCEPAGDIIRIRPKARIKSHGHPIIDQLLLFDLATERQSNRERSTIASHEPERGWTRDELYET